MGDLVEVAVGDGAGDVPGIEDRADGGFELLHWVGREVALHPALEECLVLRDECLQVLGGELGVLLDAALLLHGVEHLLEVLALEMKGDGGEHHDEAPVGIVGEALVAGQCNEALKGFVVEAQVEDSLHHAGHGHLGPRAYGNQQRVLRVAKPLPRVLLDVGEGGSDLFHEAAGDALAPEVVDAGFGCNGESRGDGEAEVAHLGQVGALAAQELLHVFVALMEEIDTLL